MKKILKAILMALYRHIKLLRYGQWVALLLLLVILSFFYFEAFVWCKSKRTVNTGATAQKVT